MAIIAPMHVPRRCCGNATVSPDAGDPVASGQSDEMPILSDISSKRHHVKAFRQTAGPISLALAKSCTSASSALPPFLVDQEASGIGA